jgi:riboflavin biosynthesis pyrimidine reductase
VEDHESALMLERELFDRGAAVVVAESPSPGELALAAAAGFIVIVASAADTGALPDAIDLQRLALEDAVQLLEKRGVISRGSSPSFIAEGI